MREFAWHAAVILTQARWGGEFPDPNDAKPSQTKPSDGGVKLAATLQVSRFFGGADFSCSKPETLAKSRFWNRYGVERLEIIDFL